jgi:hypothetical protein
LWQLWFLELYDLLVILDAGDTRGIENAHARNESARGNKN